MININKYIDNEGKIKQWPSKPEAKRMVLKHIVKSFDYGVFYTEKQVNEIIDQMHTFNDYFLLRRELIESKLMVRERDGSRYWRGDMGELCRKAESDRLYIVDSSPSEAESLKEIYMSCAYMGEWTGMKHSPEDIDKMLSGAELPPDGHREFCKAKTIYEKETSKPFALLEYYMGYPDKDVLWIGLLCIHPDFQGKGYGKELVQYIFDTAAGAGFESVSLGVHLKNWPAIRFWTKNGFDKIVRLSGDKICTQDTFCCMALEKAVTQS